MINRFWVTLNNASDYRTNGRHRTPNPSPLVLSQLRRPKFDPLWNQNSLTDCQKLSQVITAGRRHPIPNFVQIRPRGASRQMGEM